MCVGVVAEGEMAGGDPRLLISVDESSSMRSSCPIDRARSPEGEGHGARSLQHVAHERSGAHVTRADASAGRQTERPVGDADWSGANRTERGHDNVEAVIFERQTWARRPGSRPRARTPRRRGGRRSRRWSTRSGPPPRPPASGGNGGGSLCYRRDVEHALPGGMSSASQSRSPWMVASEPMRAKLRPPGARCGL